MIRNVDGTERLYLSKKSDETISIDNCKIPQHHLDGLRFLFSQYKKKKPGVIINETTGFNRNLQIVLFVKAMCHIFKQPVLVLCQEGAEHGWMEQFQTWTDLCDDVVLETRKPHIKKQVLINTMANLPSFCNRNWSVLIVDSPETDKATLQVLERFRADYKIWITPINIRENLDHFSIIYKWLYPKEKFDKNKFIPNTNNLNEVVDKAILLDAFMEDIVAGNEEDAVKDKQNDECPRKIISLKNKDATGTKIKRSKRKNYDEDDNKINNIASNEITILKDEEYDEDFSIDNFKRKRKEFHKNEINDTEESDTGIKMNTLNSQSQVHLFYEPDSPTDINNDSDKLYELDTIVFGNDTCDERSVNINETVNEIIEATKDSYLGPKEDANVNADDETPSDCDGETREGDKLCIRNNEISTKLPSTIQIESENNEINKENDNHDDELEPKDEVYLETKSPNQTKPLQICDELKPSGNKIFMSDEVQIESNCNKMNDDKSLVPNERAGPDSNALKHKCIDDKLKELEEKVMKRFKGSILDSLI
ncbi:unnamed protein product [Arctia plantaginis]|uniref:SNF2 N-terminal domain-containing protein n=1 Tax=Arctia plantaginis TaxID=874455 RepID=A0A8S0YV25_ARCPL|nr:unnamed protein product [Arctia plantaginis]